MSNVQEADNVGLGKAAAGKSYPALYTIARIGNVRGVFRSDDAGATWSRINDDKHQYGNICDAITGDPRVYGRSTWEPMGAASWWGNPAEGLPRDPLGDRSHAVPRIHG